MGIVRQDVGEYRKSRNHEGFRRMYFMESVISGRGTG